MKIFMTYIITVSEMFEVDNQDPEKEKQLVRDIEIFKIVTEHFRQDLREYWTRANFFLLAHAGLFSAFVVAYPTLAKDRPMIVMSIPILGLFIAILWLLVLQTSIYWLDEWRKKVIKLSKELDRFQCYAEIERLSERKKRFLQPARIARFLPLVFMITWLAILVSILIK